MAGGTFVLDYGNIYSQPGFDVYASAVPEPTSLALAGGTVVGAGCAFLERLRKKRLASGLPGAIGVPFFRSGGARLMVGGERGPLRRPTDQIMSPVLEFV
jgi:hypothetical protein